MNIEWDVLYVTCSFFRCHTTSYCMYIYNNNYTCRLWCLLKNAVFVQSICYMDVVFTAGYHPTYHSSPVHNLNFIGHHFPRLSWNGYGSIPIHTIFRGMNIHLPAILMFTRGIGFWPIPMEPTVSWRCFCRTGFMDGKLQRTSTVMGCWPWKHPKWDDQYDPMISSTLW